MATAVRETIIANPARRRKKKKNMAKRRRRNMSAKQIRIFGTPRQKAALKSKHKRKKKSNASHRPRTKARRTVKRANPVHHRTKRRRKTNKARRRNLGAIYALTANPAKRRNSMAKTKRRRRKSSNPSHRRAGSAHRRRHSNPARRHHSRRHNPGSFGSPSDWLYGGVGVLAGVIGTRALPQAVLSSSNTGVLGYLANAASTALLAFAAHLAAPRNNVLKASVIAGGAASIISRVIQDYTLLGSYSSSVGMGDYLVSNFLTPQYLTNGMQNANLLNPGGSTAATTATPVNVSGAGVGDIYGGSLY